MEDLELVLEQVVALRRRREVEAERAVLVLVPAGAETDLDPAAAHVVDLGGDDREAPEVAEGHGRHERAETDRCGVAARPASVVHASVELGRPLADPILR